MSYAVIQTGGKQYKVKSGEILKIEKLPDSKPETTIEFSEILAYGDDNMIRIQKIFSKDGKVLSEAQKQIANEKKAKKDIKEEKK